MCGLIVWWKPPLGSDRSRFTAALGLQSHRGPDDTVTLYEAEIWLGHNRLSILDLSANGRQPMVSADGRFVIVYNGEIYNFIELRRELQALGHRFRSTGDTEVLLAAFAQWGEAAFSRFNGMWAFAIWDRTERRLIVCRDRYGIKPLYAARIGDGWVFASEIKPIVALRAAPVELDHDAFIAFFADGQSDSIGPTWFRGIERVPPATAWSIEPGGGVRKSRWYALPDERDLAFDDISDDFFGVLENAVGISLRSDVPVGVCLSGGVDSSTIAVLAARETRIASFTARHERADSDEFGHVEALARDHPIVTHEAWPRPEIVADDLAQLVWHLEEPAKATGVYSQWQVMRLARDHVKVLLDGQGGDEVFGGYTSQRAAFLLGLITGGRLGAFSQEARSFGWRVSMQAIARDLAERIKKGIRGPIGPALDFVRPSSEPWPAHIRAQLRARIAALPKAARNLSQRLDADIYRDSLPSLLRYEDKVSMAFSLESRVPLLDHRLVDLAFRLRDTDLIRDGWTKLPLRRALERFGAVSAARRRDKLGFPTPLNDYLLRLAPAIRQWLVNGRLVESGLLDRAAVGPMIDRQFSQPHHRLLWHLLQAEWWMRTFVDGASTRPLTMPTDLRAA